MLKITECQNNRMPNISIIIPCYKAEKHIRECLVSLSVQTYKDFEVIIVDDCSPDQSFFIAEQESQKLGLAFTIIQNEKNIGPSLARKKGIMLAKANYVAFCDSDDKYDSDYLEQMVLATNDFCNDIVFCSYRSIYSNGKSISHDVVTKIMGEQKNNIIAKGTDSLCCLLVKRELLLNIEFPDIRNGEDMSIIPVLIAKAESFGFVPKSIYNYIYHENSLSKEFNPGIVHILKKSYNYILENIGESYPIETEFLGIRNFLYGALLNLLKAPGYNKEALDLINSFDKLHPDWIKNKYYSSLPMHKKVYLYFAEKRILFICRILSKLHQKISK